MPEPKTIWQRFYESCWDCGLERPEGVECPKDEEYLCVKCMKLYTKEEDNDTSRDRHSNT